MKINYEFLNKNEQIYLAIPKYEDNYSTIKF
jgi:hypothetical protein